MSEKARTIGQTSKETGVKVTTIRYYESVGLLTAPDRTSSGQRVYDKAAIERLRFIRHARELGFSVEAIAELIALQTDPDASCTHIDEIARHHLADVRRRLTQLEALEAELKRMVAACAGGRVAACSVLSSLSDHDQCLAHEHEKLDIVIGK